MVVATCHVPGDIGPDDCFDPSHRRKPEHRKTAVDTMVLPPREPDLGPPPAQPQSPCSAVRASVVGIANSGSIVQLATDDRAR